MPTIAQLEEWVKEKKRKFGANAHCSQPVVSEEARARAIENKPDEAGRRRTRIGLETYSPEAYSAWNQTLEYLMERCGYNPLLVVDLLLILVQEARKHTEGEGVDGLDIAKAGLFSVCDYEEKLRAAKAEYRARRRKSS
jgi:hypothetical protein